MENGMIMGDCFYKLDMIRMYANIGEAGEKKEYRIFLSPALSLIYNFKTH